MIHLITRISVIGIAVTTAALLILLGAFNGIESMVERLYSEFDSKISIRSAEGKTFPEEQLNLAVIKKIDGVREVSRGIEEIVILKHEKKWVNARMFGVEESFLSLIEADEHMVDGLPFIQNKQGHFGLIGAALLDKLQGYIPPKEGFESVLVYSPKRNAKLSPMSNPFHSSSLRLAGRINYNKDVNDEALVVPLAYARQLLDYGSDISIVYVNVDAQSDLENVRETIKNKLGKRFVVSTHFEKNALIYQTSKTEKIIVVGILVFVFILAIFNLVGSLTMLYIEKKDNLATVQSFGGDSNFIFRIFFFEGLLISFRGILSGLVLGGLVLAVQYYGHVLELPNSGGQAFPMKMTVPHVFLVTGIVSVISVLASYLTIYFLLKIQKST